MAMNAKRSLKVLAFGLVLVAGVVVVYMDVMMVSIPPVMTLSLVAVKSTGQVLFLYGSISLVLVGVRSLYRTMQDRAQAGTQGDMTW